MQQKAFTLHNRGMNRDLSISKAGESSAYENHNIRIIARDHDTLLSVTNERGNRLILLNRLDNANLRVSEDEQIRVTEQEEFRPVIETDVIEEGLIQGTLLGWNVLNNYLVLFTHEDETNLDRIYRIVYRGGEDFDCTLLHCGNLGFALTNPIESVVYHETDEVQKIYWVDGINVLRFMNFMDDGPYTDTSFDSNRAADFGVTVEINKDNSGNTRSNGTVQYLITYFNKHGQQTGYVWVSDLVYLSPAGVGGAADGTNNNRVTLNINNLDKTFSNFRVYSIVRTTLNGQVKAYIVSDGSTESGSAVIVDDGAHLTAVDSSSLLYLGSQEAVPNTLAHKDQTLFLGNFDSAGRSGFEEVEKAIDEARENYSITIDFDYSADVEYVDETDAYPYKNQLEQTSSEILSFKGGEKYRFAVVFKKADGTMSDAFWIGDAINPLYPVIDNGMIKRIIAKCTLPQSVIEIAEQHDFVTAQLMIAEATYADRSIKAQGIVNPTVFNVWNRYKGGLYSEASWMARPRNSDYAFRHFEPIHNSTTRTGEIDCNYWTAENDPTPYYKLDLSTTPKKYVDKFEGESDYNHLIILVGLRYKNGYHCQVTVVKGKATGTSDTNLLNHSFASDQLPQKRIGLGYTYGIYEGSDSDYEYVVYRTTSQYTAGDKRWEATYAFACDRLREFGVNTKYLTDSAFLNWCRYVNDHRRETYFFCTEYSSSNPVSQDEVTALNTSPRWINTNTSVAIEDWDYDPSYYKKHLMFVDENVITLNSPELEYEALSFDKADDLKFRIVGVAKITGSDCDYTVDATPGKLPGENLVSDVSLDQIISEPLWAEYGLGERVMEENSDEEYIVKEEKADRSSYDYVWGSNIVRYWLHMWNRGGKINGFDDYDNSDFSTLHRKVFANMRYAYDTVYCSPCDYDDIEDLRVFNYTGSQYVGLKVDGTTKYYNGTIQDSLSLPGSHKYPIMFSSGSIDNSKENLDWDAYLYSSTPVLIEYQSNPHAVISLGSSLDESIRYYTQTILPRLFDSEQLTYYPDVSISSAIIPWIKNTFTHDYPDMEYFVNQPQMNPPAGLSEGDQYIFIGEIYRDFSGNDTRYGDVKNNRFVIAGPQYELSNLTNGEMIANQGDTYFQRWDCLKTKSFSTGSTNNVIDITSVMLETHINLDGRSDLQRETKYLASIDTDKYGELNSAYSQQNNFFVRRDLDDDANLDVYHSTITWTLPKTDSAEIDEWTHITLANTLKLDGDKGSCNAIRRYNNRLIAFQDKGVAEILFNSRTQIATGDGVPIEIANSGKVDGKAYISNKYGCSNKWSIVEGKAALYFVDSMNKCFCAMSTAANGRLGIESISTKLGLDVWFRSINTLEAWTPKQFEVKNYPQKSIISFYDRIHSDVYLVKGSDDDMACLVYNEKLQMFTSFFDYGYVPMMTNVEDRFVSFKHNRLWLQNEGFYGNFFGENKDFWIQYRVTPDPFSDKVWSGFDYRADFYRVLDDKGKPNVPEEYLVNGDSYESIIDTYLENKTFDQFKVWDEYQSTGDVDLFNKNAFDKPVTKDFRIWRRTIPRAVKLGTNKHGLDRIRNPWINLNLMKHQDKEEKDLMQLHDVVVRYFE